MAGHNKWSKVVHKKGAADAKRSKLWTKIIKEITVAARMGGGDPDANPRLRRGIELARDSNVPNDTVARAIKKGTGELEGVNYEELMYEGVGPSGSLILLEILTDNRNRTASEIRKAFDVHGGSLGASGSALWGFEQEGWISIPKETATEDQLMEAAADAGANDVRAEDEVWVVATGRENLEGVRAELVKRGFKVKSAELGQQPKNKKTLAGPDAEKLLDLLEMLDDHDDVQRVFTDTEPEVSAG